MTVDTDPIDSDRLSFTKSYLLTRTIVGVTGLAFPIVLLIFDPVVYGADSVRGSLSAYYHSGMRDWFVGCLCAIGVGLFTYMGTKLGSFDNWVSTFAGVFALVVAFFPTTTEERGQIPTPLQQKFGEDLVGHIHFGAAGLFIGLLGLMCLRFGLTDGKRADRTEAQRLAWRIVHFVAAGLIWLSITVLAILLLANVTVPRAILIGELVAVIAFGTSWFFKGSEIFSVALKRDRISKAEQGIAAPVYAAAPANTGMSGWG